MCTSGKTCCRVFDHPVSDPESRTWDAQGAQRMSARLSGLDRHLKSGDNLAVTLFWRRLRSPS